MTQSADSTAAAISLIEKVAEAHGIKCHTDLAEYKKALTEKTPVEDETPMRAAIEVSKGNPEMCKHIWGQMTLFGGVMMTLENAPNELGCVGFVSVTHPHRLVTEDGEWWDMMSKDTTIIWFVHADKNGVATPAYITR